MSHFQNKNDSYWFTNLGFAHQPEVYHPVTMAVADCAKIRKTKVYRDPMTRMRHKVDRTLDPTYTTEIIVGEITYAGMYSYCAEYLWY